MEIRGWATPDALREAGRFRLWVSYACPWSHRVLIARELAGCQAAIEVVDVEPVMDDVGWRTKGGAHLLDVYCRLVPGFSERATVPLLVDWHTGASVSNESADIVQMIGGAGRLPGMATMNAYVHERVNKAMYRAGFAASAAVRSEATHALLRALSLLDARLRTRRLLLASSCPTEPDWRLWTTLVRYEPAYRPFLLANAAPPLSTYPGLVQFVGALMQVPGIAPTVRVQEIVTHYQARKQAKSRIT